MGASAPKQFLDLNGRSILQRSVAAFDAHPSINRIVVVLAPEMVASAADLVGATSKPCAMVAGGARRQDSVAAGVNALSADIDVVLIHDAARPFADAALIDRVLAGVAEAGASVPATRVRDTVKRVPAGGDQIAATVPREELWLAQTPQGFRRQILEASMARANVDVAATDDGMVVEMAGHPVKIVQGDERNVKITTPEDLAAARAATSPGSRVGTGYDLHRLVAGRLLVLAGVVIPFDKGPDGHSDGDVVCHALIDAMLGAAGAGDIGRHFPNNDPAWKDAAGLDLLARAVAIVSAAGWSVSNADITVVLERPKLAPHIQAICQKLAAVLGVAADRVSVKGKTNEGVDAVGRGEAIASHAVAMLTPAAGKAR
jgi:2-C-methyl-D-erythritol 4-phosphate cytidylyltransferase/2-C-methyl-D-erythritol 2,4-cyclodiphosphate synthase